MHCRKYSSTILSSEITNLRECIENTLQGLVSVTSTLFRVSRCRSRNKTNNTALMKD